MRIRVAALICLAGGLAFPGDGLSASGAKIVGHLRARDDHPGQADVCRPSSLPSCVGGRRNFQNVGQLNKPYDLYVLLLDADVDVSAVEFGIQYGSGLQIRGWDSCARSQFSHETPDGGHWPASGSGSYLFLRKEKREDNPASGHRDIVLGAFYVYAYANETFEFQACPKVAVSEYSDAYVCVDRADGKKSWLVYPDNHGTVTFGGDAPRDPCVDKVPLDAEVKHTVDLTATRAGDASRGSFPNRVEWTITSTEDRSVEMSIHSEATNIAVKTHNPSVIPRGKTRIVWDGRDDQGQPVRAGTFYLVVRGQDRYRAVQKVLLP